MTHRLLYMEIKALYQRASHSRSSSYQILRSRQAHNLAHQRGGKAFVTESVQGSVAGITAPTDIEACHQLACANKQSMYEDPSSGLWVMTEYALRNRGTCCGNGCRHCPYGHFNVTEVPGGNKKRLNRITRPTLCQVPQSDEDDTADGISSSVTDALVTRHVLFWTGGMESYLTLIHLLEGGVRKPLLLTTFDADKEIVPHHNVSIKSIMDQARHLGLDLILVPLPSADNETYQQGVDEALQLVINQVEREYQLYDLPKPTVATMLAFGDIHLKEVRDWRAATHTDANKRRSCVFPLFSKSYGELQEKLWSNQYQTNKGAPQSIAFRDISISAVPLASADTAPVLTVGMEVDKALLSFVDVRGLDSMGQDGSFYTFVNFGNH